MALAKAADQLAEKYDVDILFTVQHADAATIKQATNHLFITVQHIDGMTVGRGMGYVLPESVAKCRRSSDISQSCRTPNDIR